VAVLRHPHAGNCLQVLSCICHIAAIFIRDLRTLADIVDCIADTVVASVVGCMAVQINEELKTGVVAGGAPAIEIADKLPVPALVAEPTADAIERE
jgi:hypothetical protein